MRWFLSLVLITTFTSLAAGQLLVSDRASSQVLKYDATTGDFMEVLVPGDPTANGGMLAPSAMTVVGDDLLVAGLFTGNVVRYDLATGAVKGVFAEQINGPSGLFYQEETNEVLVSTLGNFDSELVMRYDATSGELLGSTGTGSGPSGRSSLARGPDDNIYVSAFATNAFFSGAVLQMDGETLEFADETFASNPLVAGGSGIQFRDGSSEGTFQLDLVGLFSNNVGRFELAMGEQGLAVTDASLIIPAEAAHLDFPSAILDLDESTMLVTNLGNDREDQGELRPGSVKRFDIASGELIDTFIEPGGEGNLTQPTALVLLPVDCVPQGFLPGDLDLDGKVAFSDFLILANNYEQAGEYADGDIDCSGIVDFPDFLVLSDNFDTSQAGQATAAAVPEPWGLQLVVIGAMLLTLCRGRRNSAQH